MQFENLKITLFLDNSSPVILNRFTTIDSILLAAYYGFKQKKGEPLPFDDTHPTVDFIEKKHGVFSGSVWYIDRTQDVFLDFHQITKKPEYDKIYQATGKKISKNPLFKQALIQEEMMLTDRVHFYIRGSRKHIEALLYHEVKSIGQKQKLGFGVVRDILIETIEQDKGYQLDEYTASKPLPIANFTVKSKKIAFFRAAPPYWKKDAQEPCYMPTTALYEVKDNTFEDKRFIAVADMPFVHNVDFIYQTAKAFKEFSHCVEKIKQTQPKKKETFAFKEGKAQRCAISGKMGTVGIHNDVSAFMKKFKSGFSDYNHIHGDNFISYPALWCIENIAVIGNTLVQKGDKEWSYLRGAKAQDGKRINDYLRAPFAFKPPFSINMKDTANQQHVSFKGKVSISNAFFYVQFGNETLQIDAQMLLEAIEEIDHITATAKHIKKRHLTGSFGDAMHPQTKKSITQGELIAIANFHKKYDRQLRYLLDSVSISS